MKRGPQKSRIDDMHAVDPPSVYLPSQAKIAAECEAIQAKWTEEELMRRSGRTYRPVEVSECRNEMREPEDE